MHHFGSFEIRTDALILIAALVVIFVQLFLCFKGKNTSVRLMFVYIFSALTVVFTILAVVFDGWNRFAFALFAVCAAFFLLVCGAAWAIWRLVKRRRENKDKK